MMKIRSEILGCITVMLMACNGGVKTPAEKLLVAGSGWDSIAIIDKATSRVEWSYGLPSGAECNSIDLTTDGNIVFAYSKGARMIDRQGNTIWDYKELQAPAELHTAFPLADGGVLLAVCDNPMRIIELDAKGLPVKEIRYDLGIENPHGQFRQVSKSKAGGYLIPAISAGKVVELDSEGGLIREYEVGGVPFSVEEQGNGNLLVGCGDGHFFVEIDRNDGSVVKKTSEDDINGVKLQFVGQVMRLDNGNTLICNWAGHSDNEEPQPAILEVDPQGNMIWNLSKDKVRYISAVYPFTE